MKSLLLIIALLGTTLYAHPLDPLKDHRICGFVNRDATGKIIRSAQVLREYQKIHPCPSTGLTTGACPGWSLNHSIPLACGGCDAVFNLTWVPNRIKTCKEKWCIDRHEREINEVVPQVPDTAACRNRFPIVLP